MLPPVDHLVYAAPDLASGVAALEAQLGTPAAYGGKHEGLGTHNALLSLGPRTYLEIIAPDPDQPPPSRPRPFGLDQSAEPRLAAWAVSVIGIESAITNARAAGYDPGDAVAMSRTPSEGDQLRWKLSLRLDLPGDGLVPFLIEWETAVHPATTAPAGCVLRDLAAEHPHPDQVAAMLSALEVNLPVSEAGRPALIATIEGPAGTVVLT
jgi:hypothetical protein